MTCLYVRNRNSYQTFARENLSEDNSTMIPAWVLLLLAVLLSVSFPIADASTSSLMKPKAVCSGHRVRIPTNSTTGIWLPLNHRHGPCSPSPSPDSQSRRRRPSTSNMLRQHHLRAAGLRRTSATTTTELITGGGVAVTVPTTLGTSLNSFDYVVTIGLGTPARTQTVLIDTGSDVSWVQCRPCPVPPCHPQKDAMFDPARSATYSPFSCKSPTCRNELVGPGLTHGCSSSGRRRSSSSRCQYVVVYGDGSNTTGTYSSDDLTFSPAASASTVVVRGFRFGCSHVVTDQLSDMLVDGLLGLGGGAPSIVTQTAEKAFSYCLPPTETHSGFLTLGVPPPHRRRTARFAWTPMRRIAGGGKTYYGVVLRGIAVAGRRLRGVPSSAFAAGAVVDSGTVVTELPETAYRALRAAFRKEMTKMHYPRAPPANGFDTCYSNLTGGGGGGGGKVPSVALVFDGGATVELDESGVVYDGCLAFYSTGDDTTPGIIGNVQQKTLEVLYDVAGQAVGFRRGAC